MKLAAKANALAAASRAAAGAIDTATAKRSPILAAVLIDATDTSDVKFSCTDLDHAVTAACAANITEAGRAATPGDALAKLFGGVTPDAEVEIEAADSGLQIKVGRARYKLPALPAENFPVAPATTSTTEIVLAHAEVQHLFADTSFCANTEGTRYYLRGTFLHTDNDGHLAAVATDGHRLALAGSTVTPTPHALPTNGESVGIIIPGKTITLINKIKAEQITLLADAKVIEIRAGKLLIASKLVDGTFPDFRKIIPPQSGKLATLQREGLLAALKRLNAVRDAAGQSINMKLAWKKGANTVHLTLADGAIGEDFFAAETTGTAQITLSISQMIVMAEEIGAKQLQLGISDEHQPMRIVAGDLLAVLAPCVR